MKLIPLHLTAGADVNLPNARGETALWLSARDGHTGVVELLVKAGAKRDEQHGEDQLTPLLCSVINEHLPTTKLLVQVRHLKLLDNVLVIFVQAKKKGVFQATWSGN